MAASPQYKVYDSHGEYQASVKELEAGAFLMGLYGNGATVRDGHSTVIWTEGAEDQPAGESYDYATGVMYGRIQGRRLKTMAPKMVEALAITEGRKHAAS